MDRVAWWAVQSMGLQESDTTEWLTLSLSSSLLGFPGGSVVKNPPANAGDLGDSCLIPGLRNIWRRAWQPTPVFLPGESHGQRSLEGYTVHRVTKSWTRLKWLSMHPLPLLMLLFYLWISKHWLSSNSQCTNTERKTKALVRYSPQVSNQLCKSVRWVEKR